MDKLFILILVSAIPVFLQIVICKINKGKIGLLLPCVFFIISLIAIANISKTGNDSVALTIFTIAIIYNIPTIVTYAIYFVYHSKEKKRLEMEKMKIMDL